MRKGTYSDAGKMQQADVKTADRGAVSSISVLEENNNEERNNAVHSACSSFLRS
jgi:hypothetical protein